MLLLSPWGFPALHTSCRATQCLRLFRQANGSVWNMRVSAPLSLAYTLEGWWPLSQARSSADLPSRNEWFDAFARKASLLCGKPVVFMGAVAIVLLWAVTGPLFNFSDTWQLVINTGTTIVTFLMVFLIQNTQNRDAMAVQIKLAELIIAVKGAQNRLANAEDLSEEDLEKLHDDYRQKAASANEVLATRRQNKPQLKVVPDTNKYE